MFQGEPKPKRIDGGHKKKKFKVNHVQTPTLTDEVPIDFGSRSNLGSMVFLQVIAAASKPPEVDPFLQDYMDDMDQNLILCRFSHLTCDICV